MRSTLPTVRNPVLAFPSARRLAELPREARRALAAALRELAEDARGRAEHAWRKHKGPMAAYWRAVSVYARHLALATEAQHGR